MSSPTTYAESQEVSSPSLRPPPPPSLDLDALSPKSAAEVTVERAVELLKAARAQERLRKKRVRKEPEGEFSVVGTLKKKLKMALAAKKKSRLHVRWNPQKLSQGWYPPKLR